MTHLIVNRVVIALCVLALFCAAAFAWLVARDAAPPVAAAAARSPGAAPVPAAQPGAALFEQHCARCHEPVEAALALRDAAADPDVASARLLDFLKEHGRATAAEDAAIVAWLRQPAS